jgi:capsular polysaccharide biosynthesis protein
VRVVQKWWWVIILLAGLIVGTGVAIFWWVGIEYEASVTVQISAPSSEGALYRQPNGQNSYAEIEQIRAGFNEVLRADEVVGQALETFTPGPAPADELRKNIIIELPPDTPEFMHVRVRAADPEAAAVIAHLIVEVARQRMPEAGFIQIVSPIPPTAELILLIDRRLIVYGAIASILGGGLAAFFLLRPQRLSGAWQNLQPYLKFPAFSPRWGLLMIFLLVILAIPFLVCNMARYRVVNEVAQVVKDHQKVQVSQEIVSSVKTLPTFSALAPSIAATLILSADRPVATTALSPTFQVESYVPPTSTSLPSTPSPTPAPVFGLVTTPNSQRLNVRAGPSIAYEVVSRLENGDEVMILQRTPDGDWLEIKTAGQQTGWIASQFIELVGDIKNVPIATDLAPTPAGRALLPLNIEGGSVSGQLASGQEQWYSFSDENDETVLIFMFTPAVGANQVQFFLFDQKQIPIWPPKNPEALANIGASSYPASDRDGDERTVELVWRGGPLVSYAPYYLRLVNRSDTVVQYCLATRDVYEWSCH